MCSAEGAHCSNLTSTIRVFVWLPSAPQERRFSEGFWTAQVETLRSAVALIGPGKKTELEKQACRQRSPPHFTLFNLFSQICARGV